MDVDHAAGPGHGALAVVEAQHQEGEGHCRPSPQATVRQRMRLRSVEPSQAASSTARIPSTPVNRSKVFAPRKQLQVEFSLSGVHDLSDQRERNLIPCA